MKFLAKDTTTVEEGAGFEPPTLWSLDNCAFARVAVTKRSRPAVSRKNALGGFWACSTTSGHWGKSPRLFQDRTTGGSGLTCSAVPPSCVG